MCYLYSVSFSMDERFEVNSFFVVNFWELLEDIWHILNKVFLKYAAQGNAFFVISLKWFLKS